MRFALALLACLVGSLPAAAATPAAPRDPVVTTIHELSPNSTIESLTNGPMPGVVTAIVDGQPLYVTQDGRFVLQGHLYDMRRGVDVSERHRAAERAKVLAQLAPNDLIVFAPQHPRYRVIAFVDPTCGYCQELVSHLGGYMDHGIEVDVAAWPRAGTRPGAPGYQRAVDVWCAPHRASALKDAFAAKPLPTRQCVNPVAEQARLAVKLGLTGTPGLLAPDGTLLGGYVAPLRLRQILDERAALANPGAGAPR